MRVALKRGAFAVALCGGVFGCVLTMTGTALAQKKVPAGAKVLLLSGGERQHHGYRAQAHYLQTVLEDSGKFQVTISEEAAVLETDAMKKYDVLLVTADRRDDEHRLTDRQQQAILDYAAGGKGVVSLHGFCCAAKDWKPEMREMLGGVLSHIGLPDTKVKVGKYTIKVAKPDHAIMRGIADFDHEDELYYYLQTVGELDAVATVRHEEKDWPIAWTRPYGKGRVFVTVFGHSRWEPGSKDPLENPPFRQMIVQAVEWAAGRDVRTEAAARLDDEILQLVLEDFASRKVPFIEEGKADGSVIVVNVQTSGRSGFSSESQVSADLMHENWKVPAQLLQDLNRRNDHPVSLRESRLGARVVFEDLSQPENESYLVISAGIRKKHPKATALVYIWLPGYSTDQTKSVVRFSFGPTPHGATATYLLVKADGKWMIKNYKFAYYV